MSKRLQNIGLMMTYNEGDLIADVLAANASYFDAILVLDGSTDDTESILKSCDKVVYILKDNDLVPKRKVRDGARQFLLEKAQEMFPIEGWFTLLHGDEIFVDDPNHIIARAEASGAERVNWHPLAFFLHTSQKDSYDPSKSLVDQAYYYQPGSLEIRQFKNKPGIFYNLNQMSNVVPTGIGWKPLLDFPILKHYVCRSPQHVLKRPWSGFNYTSVDKTDPILEPVKSDSVFKEKVFDSLSQVRQYHGSFEEFEPGKRSPFLWQWVRWHRYLVKSPH
jgi:hypothetical protein